MTIAEALDYIKFGYDLVDVKPEIIKLDHAHPCLQEFAFKFDTLFLNSKSLDFFYETGEALKTLELAIIGEDKDLENLIFTGEILDLDLLLDFYDQNIISRVEELALRNKVKDLFFLERIPLELSLEENYCLVYHRFGWVNKNEAREVMECQATTERS